MSLKSSKKVETNVYELEISIDGATFEAAIDKAYNKNKGKIVVQGFRKGKAPRAIIEKRYGKEFFYEDALDIVYPDAVEEALKEAGLEIVARPKDVEIPVIGSEGVELKMKVTVKPEVEIKDYKGLKAEKGSVEVTDEEVDARINQMLDRNSRLVNVEDRAVENGDMTVIDFEGFVDGVAFEGGKAENFNLTIGSNQFIEGFEPQLIGHNIGEEFDINVKFPEEYDEKLAGKDAVFKIKIHEIKVKELPELDDEFAKDVSEFDTVAELKENTKKEIADQKEQQVENEFESALMEQLTELLVAEIPEEMFESKMDESVNDFGYRLQMQGMDLDTYLKYTGMTKEAFRETFKEQAEKQVKMSLALEKIAELEKLEATEEEINAEYAKQAEAYGVELDIVKSAVAEDVVKNDIVLRKAVDLVKDNAVAEKKKAAKKTTKTAKAEGEAKETKTTAKKAPATKKAPAKKKTEATEEKAE